MCCLTVGGAARRCKDFDIGGNRDRLNVFDVLIAGALSPVQELLDCPVVGRSCVSVADRDRKKFKELFSSFRSGARDEGWSWERLR